MFELKIYYRSFNFLKLVSDNKYKINFVSTKRIDEKIQKLRNERKDGKKSTDEGVHHNVQYLHIHRLVLLMVINPCPPSFTKSDEKYSITSY